MTKYDSTNLKELLPLIKEGDKRAFECLYKIYVNDLYNYGIKIHNSSAEVKDCIQDLFVDLWNARINIENIRAVKVYLLKMLRYKVLKAAKKDSGLVSGDVFPKINFLVEVSPEARLVQEQLNNEQRLKLKQEIDQLAPRQKEIIYLRFYEGFKYEYIAEVLGLNIQTVHNHLFRALKQLRKKLTINTSY